MTFTVPRFMGRILTQTELAHFGPLHFLLSDENVVGDFKCPDFRNDGDRRVEDERGCRTFGCLSPEEADELETVIEEAARGLTKTAGSFLLQSFIDLDIALQHFGIAGQSTPRLVARFRAGGLQSGFTPPERPPRAPGSLVDPL